MKKYILICLPPLSAICLSALHIPLLPEYTVFKSKGFTASQTLHTRYILECTEGRIIYAKEIQADGTVIYTKQTLSAFPEEITSTEFHRLLYLYKTESYKQKMRTVTKVSPFTHQPQSST